MRPFFVVVLLCAATTTATRTTNSIPSLSTAIRGSRQKLDRPAARLTQQQATLLRKVTNQPTNQFLAKLRVGVNAVSRDGVRVPLTLKAPELALIQIDQSVSNNNATTRVGSGRSRDVASRVGEQVCQRQLLTRITHRVYYDVQDTIQESLLAEMTTENIMTGIIIPIGECIAYGIVMELADTVAQSFLAQFEGAFNSIVPDGIQLLFGPLLCLYLLKGLGRTLTISISDPLQIFLNRDLVEIVTVQMMGFLSSQGDPQLAHAVTHLVTQEVVKGAIKSITHSLTHGVTHAVTHTVTHEVIHQYYCIHCHYYNQFCSQCYHYSDDPTLHRLFQVSIAD